MTSRGHVRVQTPRSRYIEKHTKYQAFESNLQHRAVARALATWRAESGLSLKEVSDATKWSTAKTSMMQNAACTISECDVVTLALVYNVDENRREPVYLGAQRARDPRAFDRVGDVARCVGWTYSEIEAESSHLRAVAVDALPHVVRTNDYANAMREAQADAVRKRAHHYDDELRKRVQLQLHEGPILRLDLIMSEAVLRRPVGGPVVMADQLIRIMEIAELPGVNIQVLPDALGATAAISSSFSVLSFREDRFDDVVHVENHHGSTWLEAQPDREPYTQTFTRLTKVALSTEDSLGLVADAVHALQERGSVLTRPVPQEATFERA